jgi:MFS family permease
MIRRTLFPSRVHRRLAPLTVASFVGGIWLWVPVEKLFLKEIGFTPQTIGLMAAAYAAVVPLLEIPSGILADRWSRRGVLLIGNVGGFLSVVVGGLSNNVMLYVVAALLLGVYFAMQSGTVDAMVYDTVLEETGDSEQFESVIGRVRMVESAALVVGAVSGGALAALTSTRFTYFATLPFIVLATVCLATFREPRLHEAGERLSLRRHVAMTFGVVRTNRQLLPIAALLVLTSILTQAVFEFGPLWLVEADAGAGAFGPAWAGLMASLGLGGALAGRMRFEHARTRRTLVVLLLGGVAVLLVSGDAVVVTAAQIMVAMLSVVLGIFLTRLLHDAVSSDVRSGVSSGVGAVTWATFVPFALAFGALSQSSGVHVAGWMLFAVAIAIAGLLVTVTRRVISSTSPAEPAIDMPCAEPRDAVPITSAAAA